MNEKQFKKKVMKKLLEDHEGAILINLDPDLTSQGMPDLLFLYGKFWGALEFKRSAKASVRPNQDYWVSLLDSMSFSRFIEPSNMEEVLSDLERVLSLRGLI